MNTNEFQSAILQGIPGHLPAPKPYDPAISHAPKRNIEGVLTQYLGFGKTKISPLKK
jgi:hypothetical protein